MKKKANTKTVPTFRTEEEEYAFWQTHDSTDYVDYGKERRLSLEFDPSVEEPVKLISIRLPRELLNQLKAIATKKDVPYQSLIKMILSEEVEKKAA